MIRCLTLGFGGPCEIGASNFWETLTDIQADFLLLWDENEMKWVPFIAWTRSKFAVWSYCMYHRTLKTLSIRLSPPPAPPVSWRAQKWRCRCVFRIPEATIQWQLWAKSKRISRSVFINPPLPISYHHPCVHRLITLERRRPKPHWQHIESLDYNVSCGRKQAHITLCFHQSPTPWSYFINHAFTDWLWWRGCDKTSVTTYRVAGLQWQLWAKNKRISR